MLTSLSRMLRTSGFWHSVKRNPDDHISHQFYMDDLKLYASKEEQLHSEIELVKSFSDAIHMLFGLDKCAVLHARACLVQIHGYEMQISGDTVIQHLGEEDTYKCLGILQLLGISETTARKQVEKKVLSRINKIYKSFISSRNKITAINTWAMPFTTYTSGVVKWPDAALQVFDRKIRTTLTRYRIHQPKSSTELLSISPAPRRYRSYKHVSGM